MTSFRISEQAVEDLMVEYLAYLIDDTTEFKHPEDAAYMQEIKKSAAVLHNYLTPPHKWVAIVTKGY